MYIYNKCSQRPILIGRQDYNHYLEKRMINAKVRRE